MTTRDFLHEYEKQLDVFVKLCDQCVDEGMAYFTVLLCHELYRFLYPIEPFADFEHSDRPAEFAVDHIGRLIELGQAFRKTITPYPINLKETQEGEGTLEKATSGLYSTLWKGFTTEELTNESYRLMTNRLGEEIVEESIRGKEVLDMGCGSGRYSLALAQVGAAKVSAIDLEEKSFCVSRDYAREHQLDVTFYEGNFLTLPFEDNQFDFVFCNGVLHHSASTEKGLSEIARVLKDSGKAFLYLYGAGGIFWTTRRKLRPLFKKIPLGYTQSVLGTIGMPSKRFVFCDTWYVPKEDHIETDDLYRMLDEAGFSYRKIYGKGSFDLDERLARSGPQGEAMWGNGEHRYLLELK